MESLPRTLKVEMKEVERAETVSFWARTTVAGWAVTSVGGAVVARARSAATEEEERCFILYCCWIIYSLACVNSSLF